MRDYFASYVDFRGPANESAAVAAFYAVADAAGLTYADLTAENPIAAVRAAYGAAVDAAWPNRVTSGPSFEGFIEVSPL